MKATKKIVGAACALVAAVALSAGSTFAWFTSNANVSVGQISANVVTMGGDLQIAVKSQTLLTEDEAGGGLKKGEYKEGELGAYAYSVKNPFATSPVLTAVTSTNGKDFTERKVTETAPTAKANTTNSGGGYIKLTVSLRSSTAMKIYLDNASDVSSDSGATSTSIFAWKDITETDYGKGASTQIDAGDPIAAQAKNAVRVAFMTESSAGKIWAPYEDTEFAGKPTAEGFSKGNLASDYEQSIKGDTAVAYTNVATSEYTTGGLTAITKTTGTEEADYIEDSLICQLEANTAKEITICIWIEGRDGDCFNSIFTQIVKVDLAFHGVDIVPEVEP